MSPAKKFLGAENAGVAGSPECQPLFRCGFSFGESVAHYGFQSFGELSFDIDILEDGEIGALFFLFKSALLSGDDNDRNLGGFRLSFESGDELAAAHLW